MNRVATFLVGLRALLLGTLAGAHGAHAQALPSADDAAWAAAHAAGTAEACQQYLEEFPSGRHAEEAFRCLVEGQLELDPALGGPDVDVY